MDKKAKKKIQTLHERIQKLRQQLAGARKQADEPGELQAIEQQIAAAEAEIAKLKGEHSSGPSPAGLPGRNDGQ